MWIAVCAATILIMFAQAAGQAHIREQRYAWQLLAVRIKILTFAAVASSFRVTA